MELYFEKPPINFVTAIYTSFNEIVRHTFDLNVGANPVYFSSVKDRNRNSMPNGDSIVYEFERYTMKIYPKYPVVEISVSRDDELIYKKPLTIDIPTDKKYIMHTMRRLLNDVLEGLGYPPFDNYRAEIKIFKMSPQPLINNRIAMPNVQKMPDIDSALRQIMLTNDYGYLHHTIYPADNDYQRENTVVALFHIRPKILEDTTYRDLLFDVMEIIDNQNEYAEEENGSTESLFSRETKHIAQSGINWMILQHPRKDDVIDSSVTMAEAAIQLEEIIKSIRAYPLLGYSLNSEINQSQLRLSATETAHARLLDQIENQLSRIFRTTRLV